LNPVLFYIPTAGSDRSIKRRRGVVL